MIFKSIKLENFRQYKDVQVDFSDSINVIEAGNGVGKSTLMAAFIFAMFGYEQAKNSGFIEVTEMTPLINMDCLDIKTNEVIDENQEVKVHLVLKTNNNTEYTIYRAYKPYDETDDFSVKKVSKDNNYYSKDVSPDEVYSIIPEEFIPLLFFDGERIKKIEDSISNASGGFKDEVEKILKIKELNEAKLLINRTIKKLSSETHFENPKINELNKEIQRIEKIIESKQQKIDSDEIKLNELETSKNDINLSLQEIEEVKAIAKKISNIEEEIVHLSKKSKEENMKAREQIFTNYPDIIRLSIYDKMLDTMSESVSNYNITGIEQSAVDSIISNGKCICKTPLDDEKIHALKELRKVLPPESFQTILSVKLDNKDDEIARLKKNIKNFTDSSFSLDDEVTDAKNMKHTLIERIKKEYTKDEISNLIEENDKVEEEIDKIKLNIHDNSTSIKKFDEILTKNKKLYDAELKKEQKKEVEKMSIGELQMAEDTVKANVSSRKANLKDLLEKRVNYYANELLSEGIKIDLNSYLRPQKIRLDNRSQSLSTGQGVIVSLSYLFALMETSKEETDYGYHISLTEDYPLVFDGITATLDDYHTRRIIDYIKRIDSQFIIFANTKEVKLFNEQLNGEFKKLYLNKEKNSNSLNVEE